ncbi:hypothetical protein [Portibacter lacus]|uniref:Uncharacterized protein n=1 Tax=Portibacter lacus TaxID=1099794 RepID=A0AA37SL08_9BACT|nr:hypothetical protein [Portibacter lacus]GLR15865.1 hypothetical protein GCM10007940_04800 [Portibacter lacus]
MAIEIITKPKVEIDPSLLNDLKTQIHEQGQVIFHCLYNNRFFFETAIRIWSSTYLYDHHSDHKSELVHAEKIVYAPEWQMVPPMSSSHFTLIFSGLPKSCTLFDFVEQTNSEQGAFIFKNIERNNQDVYYARIK